MIRLIDTASGKVRADIELGNAAFGSTVGERDAEIAAIGDRIRQRVAIGHSEGRCMDTNGNSVGTWRLR